MQRNYQGNIPKKHYYSSPFPVGSQTMLVNLCDFSLPPRVMIMPLELKANKSALGLAFNQASGWQQISHHYHCNFYKVNYLKLHSHNELCTATNEEKKAYYW